MKVSEVAVAFGLKAYESRTLPDGISGKLFYDPKNGGDAQYSIVVNATEPRVRKRFTIAHEIAHFILHRKKIDETGSLMDDTHYRSGLSTAAEIEANALAAEILMPTHLIDRLVSQGITKVEDLADRLDVSELAMKIRMRQEPTDLP